MVRNEAKPKSARKALREVSNNNNIIHTNINDGGGGGRFSKSMNLTKKSISKEEFENQHMVAAVQRQEGGRGGGEGEEFLDRLLVVQSDLSSLTRQIDELVAQAFKMEVTSKQGRREIESFSHVLSDMFSSLKPWVPRFQKALSNRSAGSKNQLGWSLAEKTVSAVNEDENFEVESPDQTRMNSLISPSPLVSWRAECNIDRGRQLFLLTPLPMSKTLSFKRQDSSKSVSERIASNPAVELPSFLEISGYVNDDLLEGIATKPTPNKPSDLVVTKAKTARNSESISSPNFSRSDHSALLKSPCLKMSPPKSCVLLEPISETSHKSKAIARKSTPFPTGIHSQISESSSESEDSEDLAMKYPELLGIQRACISRMGKKDLETSPSWFFSPPKTCVLLEPPDEKPLASSVTDNHLPAKASILNQKTVLILSKECNDRGCCLEVDKSFNEGGNLTLIESTPIWKEPESTMRMGKRPGENTLKKELWTKFEAASTYGIRLNVSALQKTARKGFLDMLDEVSFDGETTVDDGLR